MPQRSTWRAAAAAVLCLTVVPSQAQDAGSGGAGLSGGDLVAAWKAFRPLKGSDSHLDRLSAARQSLSELEASGASDIQIRSATTLVTKLTFDEDVWDLRVELKSARKLLEEHDSGAAGGLDWDSVYQLIQGLAYEHDPAVRIDSMRKLDALVRPITARVAALLPEFFAYDKPNDAGKEIVVGWRPRDDVKEFVVTRIDLSHPDFESEDDEESWEEMAKPGSKAMALSKDDNPVTYAHRYKYRLYAVDESGAKSLIATTAEVKATGSVFNTGRFWFMLVVGFFCAAVIYYIQIAAGGAKLNIRKIAGLEAVDEAVGRATEMGRPILFIPGIQDMNDIQTVAGLTILGHVAKIAAEHDAQLEVPTSRSLVMTTARETVAAAYLDAGRPDAYDEKKIYYVTDEQFGYVAAVTGTMVREKPAACIYMGAFYAESLILAETANATGAIQIAGTAMPAQLPFFVAACDYTLIGEEFFAASAYLSGEPRQLGSLKGQDVGKVFALILLTVGAGLTVLIAFTGGWRTGSEDALRFILNSFLNTSGT